MASIISTALVPYKSFIEQAKARQESLYNLFAAKSFRLLSAIPIRERILAGTYEMPQIGAGLPEPFKGTRDELLKIITDMVHKTVNNLDYDGTQPFLKITAQLQQGKTFRQVKIDSRNEGRGSTCVGMSHILIKKLKQKNIESSLAVQRKVLEKGHIQPFEHGAVIIECADGFVLLDARANPDDRIFSIPFGSTIHHKDFSITASKAGSLTPLIQKYEKTINHPETTFEYCVNVGNGDDLVMKYFVMHAPYTDLESMPICVYNLDGSEHKFILVFPNKTQILFKDQTVSKKNRPPAITFKSIREENFRPKLEAFMAPNYCCTVTKFNSSIDTVYRHIVQFAYQEKRIQQLFSQIHPDEAF